MVILWVSGSCLACYARIQFLVLSACFIGLIDLLAIVLAHSWFTAQIDVFNLRLVIDL